MLKKDPKTSMFIPMGESLPQQFFQNQIEGEWFTSSQAARYLGISENALRIMVHRRQIRFHKLGRRLRIHRSAVFELLPTYGGSR